MLEVGSDRSATRAREDYVKAIYQLGAAGPVRAADVARHLGVTPVSVSKAKRSLERDGLLMPSGKPTDHLTLSPRGSELAVGMIRRHRLLETFLYRDLDVPIDLVHAEAERIEHAISDDIARRLAKHMGFPACDPHGHEIPYGAQDAPRAQLPSLAAMTAPCDIRVASLDDRNAGALRELAAAGVLPGLEARLLAIEDGAPTLAFDGRSIRLNATLAGLVRVVAHDRAARTPRDAQTI